MNRNYAYVLILLGELKRIKISLYVIGLKEFRENKRDWALQLKNGSLDFDEIWPKVAEYDFVIFWSKPAW